MAEKAQGTPQRWRIFCSRLRRRMRFLRHFQRILPRFFHARELRFMGRRRGVTKGLLNRFRPRTCGTGNGEIEARADRQNARDFSSTALSLST